MNTTTNVHTLKANKHQLEKYPNLHFYNAEHLANSLLFALENYTNIEKDRTLDKMLNSLNHMAENNKSFILLSPDFVKHSFYWQMYNKDGIYDMNGGIILHGYEETFSVEVDSPNKPHWSIHT